MKNKLIQLLPMAIILVVGACGQQGDQNSLTNTQSMSSNKMATAAVILGSNRIVELTCVQQAVKNNSNPDSCPELTPTTQSSDRALSGERGFTQPYGWFDYYGNNNYSSYVYYYRPTAYNNFCSQVLGYSNGYSSGSCNSYLGYSGTYTPTIYSNNYVGGYAYYGNTYNTYSPWYTSLGGGGWWWR